MKKSKYLGELGSRNAVDSTQEQWRSCNVVMFKRFSMNGYERTDGV